MMGENRLMEIASTINMLDGPMLVISYLMSLKESDMYLFLRYVRGSKYKDANFYVALKSFASDYLEGKTLELDNSFAEELGYYGEMSDVPNYSNGYSDNYSAGWNSSDDYVQTRTTGRR